jgi:hypothetical protein
VLALQSFVNFAVVVRELARLWLVAPRVRKAGLSIVVTWDEADRLFSKHLPPTCL